MEKIKLLSIIVPVHNEQMHINALMNKITKVKLPEDIDKEIIIVDDGSTDETPNIINEIKKNHPDEKIFIHHTIINIGKGAATRVGIFYAKGDIILIQDGDLEYDPFDYPKLIQPIIEGKAKVVYGSRFLGSIKNMRSPNLMANKILTFMSNFFYNANITDEATCYKVFHKDVIKNIKLRCTQFEFCPEVTAKVCKAGHKIYEVPINYVGRTIAEGKKIRWKDGVRAIWELLRNKFSEY